MARKGRPRRRKVPGEAGKKASPTAENEEEGTPEQAGPSQFVVASGREEILQRWFALDKEARFRILDCEPYEMREVFAKSGATVELVDDDGRDSFAAALEDSEEMGLLRQKFVDAVARLDGAIEIDDPLHFYILSVFDRHLVKVHVRKKLETLLHLYFIFFTWWWDFRTSVRIVITISVIFFFGIQHSVLQRCRFLLIQMFHESDPAFMQRRCRDFLVFLTVAKTAARHRITWFPELFSVLPYALGAYQNYVSRPPDVRSLQVLRYALGYGGEVTALVLLLVYERPHVAFFAAVALHADLALALLAVAAVLALYAWTASVNVIHTLRSESYLRRSRVTGAIALTAFVLHLRSGRPSRFWGVVLCASAIVGAPVAIDPLVSHAMQLLGSCLHRVLTVLIATVALLRILWHVFRFNPGLAPSFVLEMSMAGARWMAAAAAAKCRRRTTASFP